MPITVVSTFVAHYTLITNVAKWTISRGDVTIATKHIVFTFNGTSATGKYMDPNADSVDGQTALILGNSTGCSSIDYYG